MNNEEYLEAHDLAVAMLGLDESSDAANDEDFVAEKFEREFGVDLEQLHKIASALIPLTVPAKSALTGRPFQGFARDGCFVMKRLVD